jgi:hypothetical protein
MRLHRSWRFNLFGTTCAYTFRFYTFPTPDTWTAGKSSRIPKTIYHVLFLDYDEIDEETLIEELTALIEESKIGNIYLFKMDREQAFHCICLDYFTFREVKLIALSTSCDIAAVIAPRYDKFRNWILRDAPKGERTTPVAYKTIESPYDGKRKQSSAHARFLNSMYGTNIQLKNPDNNPEDIEAEAYKTASRTKRQRRNAQEEKTQ